MSKARDVAIVWTSLRFHRDAIREWTRHGQDDPRASAASIGAALHHVAGDAGAPEVLESRARGRILARGQSSGAGHPPAIVRAISGETSRDSRGKGRVGTRHRMLARDSRDTAHNPAPRLRIAAALDAGTTAGVLAAALDRALAIADLIVAVAPGDTPDDTRSLLADRMRRDQPIVVFDTAATGPPTSAQWRDLVRNTHRFFRPDVVIVLHAAELSVCHPRPALDTALAPCASLRGAGVRRIRTPRIGAVRSAVASATRPATADEWAYGRLWSSQDLSALEDAAGLDAGDPPGAGEQLDSLTLSVVDPESTVQAAAGAEPSTALAPARDAQAWARAIEARRGQAVAGSTVPGVLGPDFHLTEFYLDLPPFRYIADKHQPRSVLDIGCGLGGYLAAFELWGAAEIRGVDGFADDGSVFIGDRYRCHDLRVPLDLGRTFDLVLCTEVAEHLPAEAGVTLLETVARHARSRIVFSAARPGQPGFGHINCRPLEDWLRDWARLGWTPHVFDTCAMRALGTYYWFRRNLVVLTRTGRGGAAHGMDDADLVSVEVGAVRWRRQDAGVIVYPLGVPPPAFEPVPPPV